jgi:hypothetical protein
MSVNIHGKVRILGNLLTRQLGAWRCGVTLKEKKRKKEKKKGRKKKERKKKER